MPNGVKYSTTTPSGSLRRGNVALGVTSNLGPSATTGFYSMPAPQSGKYIINKVSPSGIPNFFAPANDTELIRFARAEGAVGADTGSAAAVLAWMATQDNLEAVNFEYPNIVTDGLIFNLDAGFTPSYPTTGTDWYDLNGTKNVSLINGPTFNSANSGSIVFDGVDDRGDIPSSTFGYSPGTTGEVSLEIWVYPTGPFTVYNNEPPTTNLGGFIGQGYFGGSTGWGLGMFAANGNNYFAFQVRNQGTIVQVGENSNHIFTNNNWYHVVGSFTRNDFSRVYINGALASSISSTPLNGISITPNDANAQISKINPFFSGCRIAIGRVYNRPLSAAEVTQNYNAQKGRFGL